MSTVDSFIANRTAATVQFGDPPSRTYAATVRLPSNGTVSSANVTVEPGRGSTSFAFRDNVSTGFASGQLSGGAALGPAGLSLAIRSGSAEFERML